MTPNVADMISTMMPEMPWIITAQWFGKQSRHGDLARLDQLQGPISVLHSWKLSLLGNQREKKLIKSSESSQNRHARHSWVSMLSFFTGPFFVEKILQCRDCTRPWLISLDHVDCWLAGVSVDLPSGKHKKLWKITFFNGKTHYNWGIVNSYFDITRG